MNLEKNATSFFLLFEYIRLRKQKKKNKWIYRGVSTLNNEEKNLKVII